jgi:hypothetical protein
MGLYLCIFDGDEEVDGVEVGPYADFGTFRDCIVRELEGGSAGSKLPTLILHSDCDGEWSPSEAGELEKELISIGNEFRRLPPIPIGSDWKKQVVKNIGLRTNNLYDCFFDVDGEPLLERLIGLAKLSQARNLPILFQ